MNNQDIDIFMRKYEGKKTTRGKAIKVYCKEMCCAGDLKSWSGCDFYACPLWKYRLGRELHGNQKSFKKDSKNPVKNAKKSLCIEKMTPNLHTSHQFMEVEAI